MKLKKDKKGKVIFPIVDVNLMMQKREKAKMFVWWDGAHANICFNTSRISLNKKDFLLLAAEMENVKGNLKLKPVIKH